MTRNASFILLAVLVTAATGLAPAASAAAPEELALRGFDRELYELGEVIPGFGGLFIDEQERLNVYLTDPAVGALLHRIDPQIQIRQGDFEIRELAQWRADLRPALSHADVVFVDLDESANRIRVGVSSEIPADSVRSIREQMATAGVPGSAVVLETADPIYFAATLQDRVRPVPGSMQVNFSNFLCTLTFNADRSGVFGHVVNSHCTDKQGGVESTEYFQPTESVDPTRISVEIADPEYFRRGECPRGRKCRFSDSAFADYDSDSTGELGKIARTEFRDPLEGSLTIDSSNPRFDITAEDLNDTLADGTELNKIGRTTGWTFGDVDGSCVDVNVAQSNITLLCQTIVNAGVGGGDSGSPVFAWDGSSSGVTLNGILWGGNSAGTLFVFSPLSAIEQELGSLTTH